MAQQKSKYKWLAQIFRVIMLAAIFYFIGLTVAVYFFDRAENHKPFIEGKLSQFYQQQVTIEKIDTTWNGVHPSFSIHGIAVQESKESEPELSIDAIAGQIDAYSIFTHKPVFTSLAISKPKVKIKTLDSGQLQVAGYALPSKKSQSSSNGLVDWLLNNHDIAVYQGEINWHRTDSSVQQYKNTSLVYKRLKMKRELSLLSMTPKGELAFSINTQGDVLASKDWSAAFEVLGDNGNQLVTKDSIKLNVEDGQGELTLAKLDLQRISDITNLLSLNGKFTNWLKESNVQGSLHDVELTFSGPLTRLNDWSLNASSSDVSFSAVTNSPGMTNLQGILKASSKGGVFEFSTNEANLDWPNWFPSPLPIDVAEGSFAWQVSEQGQVDIALENGKIKSHGFYVSELNAQCQLELQKNKIENLADVFRVKSISDLTYHEGNVVDTKGSNNPQNGNAVLLDVDGKFEIASMSKLAHFFPNKTKPIFKNWWKKAFVGAVVEKGQLSYHGPLNKTSLNSGDAVFTAQAQFKELTLDYVPGSDWPVLNNGKGSVDINNDVITIKPDQIKYGDNPITNSLAVLSQLFSKERQLSIDGSLAAPLTDVIEFLFQGPLVSDEGMKKNPPLTAESGEVVTDLSLIIPLNKVKSTSVKGSAFIKKGELILPGGVLLSDINGPVRYTERSVETDKLNVDFLGGKANIQLQTTKQDQPPNLKIIGDGKANVKELEPWAGKHLSSMIDGVGDWKGSVEIKKNKVNVDVTSQLQGVTVLMPPPIEKPAKQESTFELNFQTGGDKVQNRLSFDYGEVLKGQFIGNVEAANSLYDQAIIRYDENQSGALEMRPGVNFHIETDEIDITKWIDKLIDLSSLEIESDAAPNTEFLDSMRSLTLNASKPFLFGRDFAPLSLSALSVDGASWIGTIRGEQINGTLQAEPRSTPSSFRFNLADFTLPDESEQEIPLLPIEQNAKPENFPDIAIKVNALNMFKKDLGRLELQGAPNGDVWKLNQFLLEKQNLKTTATGSWKVEKERGSISEFELSSSIREVGDVMGNLDMDGIIKKGKGSLKALINWRGGPDEFDLSRLNGEFDFSLKNGELLKIEPGSGKLVGLLNVNALIRRLKLNFNDLFSSGLQFDRLQSKGLLVDGDMILSDAYIFSPAVYIRAEGRIGLDKEDMDLEVHVSPELGGNLALLSALANPAAGAVLFITQKLFKNELRNASFKTYSAKGGWESAEIEELSEKDQKAEKKPFSKPKQEVPSIDSLPEQNTTKQTERLDQNTALETIQETVQENVPLAEKVTIEPTGTKALEPKETAQ